MLRATVAAIAIWAGQASAEIFTGQTLHDWCSSSDTVDQSVCFGYWMGVTDATIASDDGQACVPNDAPLSIRADVATQYLVQNPAKRTEQAAKLYGEAMREAFQCE